MAAPTVGNIGTNLSSASGTSAVVSAPTGVGATSIVVVTLFLDGAAQTVTPPDGSWSYVENCPINVTGGSHGQHTFWARNPAGSTYTFTWPSSTYRSGFATRFDNCVTTGNPFDTGTGAAQDNTSANASPPVSNTTAGPDRLQCWFATNWSGGTWTQPTGYTKQREGGDQVIVLATLTQTTAGGSGSVSGSCTGTDKRTALLAALIGTTTSSTAVGPTSTARHPGTGPTNARFIQSPRSTQITTAQSTAENGVGTVGLTSSAVAKKVAADSGTAAIGVAATGSARKVSPSSGSAPVGAFTKATGAKRAVETGSASAGVTGTANGRKVAVVTGSCAVGISAAGVAAKHAAAAGPAPVGLTSTATAVKKATETGAAPIGLVGTRSGLVSRAQAGSVAVGLATTGTAQKKASGTGSSIVGPTSTGRAAKKAATSGAAPVGLAGTRAGTPTRAVSGSCVLALTITATPRKLASVSGTATAGVVTRATPQRTASQAGRATLAAALLSAASKVAVSRGTASVGLVGTAASARHNITVKASLAPRPSLAVTFGPKRWAATLEDQ